MRSIPNKFSQYADRIRGLASQSLNDPAAIPNLRMESCQIRNREVTMCYAPFDHVNRDARIVIVGMTPGRQQAANALRAAQAALMKGSLHADLWAIFKPVKNKADIEQYRQLLVPQTRESEDGTPIDLNQKLREDFYEALTAYGMCLKIALGSRSFFEDTSITERQIAEDTDLEAGVASDHLPEGASLYNLAAANAPNRICMDLCAW